MDFYLGIHGFRGPDAPVFSSALVDVRSYASSKASWFLYKGKSREGSIGKAVTGPA